jgi:hypothetical protein
MLLRRKVRARRVPGLDLDCSRCGGPISPRTKSGLCWSCFQDGKREWAVEDLVEMRLAGRSWSQIARAIGRSKERVRQLIRFWGPGGAVRRPYLDWVLGVDVRPRRP